MSSEASVRPGISEAHSPGSAQASLSTLIARIRFLQGADDINVTELKGEITNRNYRIKSKGKSRRWTAGCRPRGSVLHPARRLSAYSVHQGQPDPP